VEKCAQAFALSSESVWRRGGLGSRSAVYVLTTLVAQSSHVEVASAIVRLWFRQDALRKLLMKTTCYLQLLTACLCSCAPERPRLVALLLCSFEESPDLRYAILRSIARTPQEVGAEVLCALGAASEEIFGVQFPEFLTGLVDDLERRRPRVALPSTLVSHEAVSTWMARQPLAQPRNRFCA